jgi:membrane associated rhomboid family serine protease
LSDGSWVEVGHYSRPRDAESAALVLAAAGIGSHLLRQRHGVTVFVAATEAVRASRELIEYDSENIRRPEQALPSLWEGADAAFAYATLLIVVFVAAGRNMLGLDWETAGYADAGLIRAGEWWRALTALTLHANIEHLASNLFAGGVLGLFLAQRLGPGLAWLAVLIAGGLGNVLNALFEPASHAAIGASTAVFAALGLLATLVWRRGPSNWARGLRAWLPLAAGVMLLAFLGFGGEKTDIGGHVAGFLVGIVGGVALHFADRRIPGGRRAQYAYGFVALALIGAAWLAGLTVAQAAR